MIVNKPQFDAEKIKPGQVYWLTKKLELMEVVVDKIVD